MIGIIETLSVNISSDALLSIYKSFIRPDLDFENIIYVKPNKSLKNKIEISQYKACIAITGVIQGKSFEDVYQELDLESLEDGR